MQLCGGDWTGARGRAGGAYFGAQKQKYMYSKERPRGTAMYDNEGSLALPQKLAEHLAILTNVCISETIPLADVADRIAELVNKYIPSDIIQILLYNGRDLRVVTTISKSSVPAITSLPLDKSICALAISNENSINVPNRHEKPWCDYYCETVPGMVSELATPVFVEVPKDPRNPRDRFHPLAVINLESYSPNRYSDHDRVVLEFIAKYCAALFRVADTVDQLQAIVDAISDISTEKIDINSSIQSAIERILKPTLGWYTPDHLELCILDKDQLHILYSTQKSSIGIRLPGANTACYGMLTRPDSQATYYPDISEDDKPNNFYQLFGMPTKSVYMVPIRQMGNIIAVLNVESSSPNAFGAYARLVLLKAATRLGNIIHLLRTAYILRDNENEFKAVSSIALSHHVIDVHRHTIITPLDAAKLKLELAIPTIKELLPTCYDIHEALSVAFNRIIESIGVFTPIRTSIDNENPFDAEQALRVAVNTYKLDREMEDAKIKYMQDVHDTCGRVKAICPGFDIALFNTISNAIRAVRKVNQPRITVEVKGLAGNGSKLEWLQFSVHDNGVGMDEETMESLFSPPSTSKKAVHYGFGMYLAGLVVKARRGTLDVSSTQGVGTTVIFTIPCVEK